MLSLFHLGITVLIATLIGLPVFFSMIGAILPDIIDKGLFFVGITPYGRFFAHTVFFGPLLALIVFAITKRKSIALSILLGCYIHLLLDMGYFLPLFYPLVKYELPTKPFELGSWWSIIVYESLGAAILYNSVRFKPEILYYRNKVFVWMKKSIVFSNSMKRKRKK